MLQPTKQRIHINEVSPRDGFQNEKVFIETADKVKFIDQLSGSGLSKIEVTSFTSPKAIPALADAQSVMSDIKRNADIIYTVLVPNVRGAERALACEPDEINLVMSASEAHNMSNMRMTREQSAKQLSEIIDLVKGSKIRINVSLSTVFGCPMEGDVDPDTVLRLADHFVAMGIDSLTLCDTTGMAYPTQVHAIAKQAIDTFNDVEVVLHFHNTRGMALANVMASLDAGVTRFDASLGGLGGCPYAPGASGNLCTEELVHMLDLMGYDTGVDIDTLLRISEGLPKLIGHDTPSQLVKSGLRSRLHPAPVIA